jgi:hypothetical protein
MERSYFFMSSKAHAMSTRRFFAVRHHLHSAVWAGLTALCMAGAPNCAAAVTVANIKLEDSLDLRGTTLQLNGAGVRYKAVFKVYVAALYLGKKSTSPEEILQSTGAKRISITMLRDIDSNELGKLFTRSVEDNVPRGDLTKLIPDLVRMGQIFADQKKLQPGEVFTVDYLPGTGTVIAVKGVAQGEPFKEPDFFTALLRIWLGKSPADHKLKDALLGKSDIDKNF